MRRQAVVLPAVLLAVPLAAPTPGAALSQLGLPGSAPLLAVVALAAWGCEGWLLVITVLTLLERRSGRLARGAAQLLERLAPAPVRTAARIALGATLLTGALGSVPATASPAGHGPTSGRAATVLLLDRPTPAPPRPPTPWPTPALTPALDWPVGTAPVAQGSPSPAAPIASAGSAAPAAAPAPAVRTAPADDSAPAAGPAPADGSAPPDSPAPALGATSSVVVVQPGDCLWRLAARSLGPSTTAARIAAAWPSWWSANRRVIGDDPDLLQPGTRLVPPAS